MKTNEIKEYRKWKLGLREENGKWKKNENMKMGYFEQKTGQWETKRKTGGKA